MILSAVTLDLSDVADASTYHLQPGGMRRENTVPAMVDQVPAEQPTEFARMGSGGAILSPGFKLATQRIMRLGGNRGTPSGPPLSHPRLRRRIPNPPGPIASQRAVRDMAAGLIPTVPVYEQLLYGGADTYVAT